MKLSDLWKVQNLVKERERLRDSIGDALADRDLKIELRGREAQGVVRERIIKSMKDGWFEELAENTKNLEALGVEADDPPPVATRPLVAHREDD